jgi:microcystin-dependent protein
VTPGHAYIAGLRAELAASSRSPWPPSPATMYADVYHAGSLLSDWVIPIWQITVSAIPLADYVDGAGYPHYVTPIASLETNGSITDLRGRGGMWWHEKRPPAHTPDQVGLDKLENWSWSHSYTDTTGGATKYASGKAVADAYNALNNSKLDKTGTAVNAEKLGNQLPAYYLDWGNFTGVPTTATRWPTFAEVTGKPATYPPDSHAHTWASITDKPATFPPSGHTHSWEEVSGKPATYPPTSHGHSWDEITEKPSNIAGDPGQVAAFAMATPPSGWLKANGAAVSRTTYAALFAAIGTTFGEGDGSTTFNLPDLRGEFVRGWDDGRGVDSGRGFGSYQGHTLGSHNHYLFSNQYVTGSNSTANISSSGHVAKGTGGGSVYEGYNLRHSSATPSLGLSSANGSSETRPRNRASTLLHQILRGMSCGYLPLPPHYQRILRHR